MADPNSVARVPVPEPVTLIPFPDHESAAPQLPNPLTSFIGRSSEIAKVSELIRRPGNRLITLTGPGGVGKTRLAIRIAGETAVDFPRGVWFVALAPMRDPTLVLATIADVLGVRESETRTLATGIREYLRERPSLLVLDNFEHLLEAGSVIVELLENCPSLSILGTSRTALRISGEHIFVVPPFPVSGSGPQSHSEVATHSDAYLLFVERAISARGDFVPTEIDGPAIASICGKLDGLPLAIELAAGRISLLSPLELEAVVERRLAVLTGGPRDQPARLRSMRDAIAWSYGLLSSDDQQFFQRLSVFIGGFTLESAAVVANNGANCLDRMTSLVSNSLVVRDQRADIVTPDPRFTMLETLREFGLEQLAASGDESLVRQLHADYFCTLIERITPSPRWPPTDDRIRLISIERNNLRETWSWLGRIQDYEQYLHLGSRLYPLWGVLGHVSEGLQVLERGVTEGATVSPFPRAVAHAHAGSLTNMLGDPDKGLQMIEESLAWARTVAEPTRDNRLDMAIMLGQISQSLISMGRFKEAVPFVNQSLIEYQANGSDVNVSRAVHCLALAEYGLGDLVRARAHIDESLVMCRGGGNQFYTAASLALSGLIAIECRHLTLAADELTEAIQLGINAFDPNGDDERIGAVGVLASKSGAPDVAALLLGAAQSLSLATGTTHKMPTVTTFEREAAMAQVALEDEKFGESWSAGQRLSRPEALAEAQQFLSGFRRNVECKIEPATADDHGLTPRERDVVRLLAAGYSNRKIAAELSISERTVEHHVLHVLTKLGLESRTAVAVFAHANGLA